MNATELPSFRTIADLIHEHALVRPKHPALSDDEQVLDYAALDTAMDRVAAALQRDGLARGDVLAICAMPSVRQALVFLGALRAGVVTAPMAPSLTVNQMALMLRDCGAALGFFDATSRRLLPEGLPLRQVALDDADGDAPGFTHWLAEPAARPQPVDVLPEDPFNIIYSSGTTGAPKGIVQSHLMRWNHVMRAARYGYDSSSVALLSTPLYSNTTLVAFLPALASGSHVHLMRKFDAVQYLERAQQLHVTHTMLVPVQYRRLLAHPRFGEFNLGSFKMKLCTSAPFDAALKAEVLKRWPGGLVEIYGMTEGGGSCLLDAHLHPDKLHTVGRPAPGHELRLIDEQGLELAIAPGVMGELVGRSPAMMTGYHGQAQTTREAEWFDASGRRHLRTGDIGRFDEDGFLILMDRRKDMIISGGFNIFPSDLEAVLSQHPQVAEAAVIGVPSDAWGETPVAFVVGSTTSTWTEPELLHWFNSCVGKTQRLHAVRRIDELPRSPIGKVLKRLLVDRFQSEWKVR